jgi:Spy/CpxP family protein refolding chaperone
MNNKYLKWVGRLGLGAALLGATAVWAGEDKPADKSADGGQRPLVRQRVGPGGGPGGEERMKRITEELGLSDEQKTQWEAVLKEQREKMSGLRDLEPEERRAKMTAFREENQKKMKEILTAEQYEKWQKLQQERWQNPRRNRPGGPGNDQGGPAPRGERPPKPEAKPQTQ